MLGSDIHIESSFVHKNTRYAAHIDVDSVINEKKIKLTSDVEYNGLGHYVDTVHSAADVRAGIGTTHVGDDQHASEVVSGPARRQLATLFAPLQTNLSTLTSKVK